MYLNTMKYKNAEWFQNTTAKPNAAKYLSIIANNAAFHAKNMYANQNAVMFANTTGNILATVHAIPDVLVVDAPVVHAVVVNLDLIEIGKTLTDRCSKHLSVKGIFVL